jgi:hypothetical protein
MTTVSHPEPDPIKNTMPAIWPLVIKDMCDRHQIGCEKYGTPLQANNGRRPLVDAYQELLDLVVYLRQELVEREQLEAEVVRLCARNELLQLQIKAWQDQDGGAKAAATLMPAIAVDDEEWQPLPCMHTNPIATDPELPMDGQQIDAELRAAHHGQGARPVPPCNRIENLGFICNRRRESAVDGVNA